MIGFYAHHHGSGHVHRCRAIMAALDRPAQLLSTDPSADVVLVDDAGASISGDRDAHGTLHHVPPGHAGLRGRMAQIAAWIEEHRPAAFYVDVSVEVALLVRLMGVPVITLAMPGVRDDAAHQLGYRQAAAIIAAWPNWVPLPEHLRAHGPRVHQVGGISRFRGVEDVIDGDVVVLSGRGGSGWTRGQWDAVQEACPDRSFRFLGGDTAVANDPSPSTASVPGAGVGDVARTAVSSLAQAPTTAAAIATATARVSIRFTGTSQGQRTDWASTSTGVLPWRQPVGSTAGGTCSGLIAVTFQPVVVAHSGRKYSDASAAAAAYVAGSASRSERTASRNPASSPKT